MSFRVKPNNRFWWPVEVKLPSPEKPGEFETQGFEVEFEAIGRKEAHDMDEVAARAATVEEVFNAEMNLLKRVVRDWRGVEDDKGKALAFSTEAFEAACDFPWTRRAIYDSYTQAVSGEARRKN